MFRSDESEPPMFDAIRTISLPRPTALRLLVAIATGTLAFAAAEPAAADTTGISAATITVQGGFLSITVPTDAGNLGTRTNSVAGGTISGPLGQVQVNDARSAAAGSGWVASVISTAFTPPAGPAIAASAVELHRRSDHQGRHRDLHGEQPDQPHRRRRRGHRDRDHRRQLRDLEPDDQRGRARRHGRRRLLRNHHPLRCLARGLGGAAGSRRASRQVRPRRHRTAARSSLRRGRDQRAADGSPTSTAAGGIGLRLLEAPVRGGRSSSADLHRGSPRAGDGHPPPRSRSPTPRRRPRVVSYPPRPPPSREGSFLGAAGHTANDLSTWTSVSPGASDVPAGGRATATVTIAVPSDAAPGEQYGVVWAEARSAPVAGGGITQVSRVGIRLYVSVGPGGRPRPTSRSTR